MPAMTEPVAPSTSAPDWGADPRRVALVDLVRQLAQGVAMRARDYESAAAQASGELQAALERLARAKQAEAADLLPLARALGVTPPGVAPSASATAAPRWGVILGQAFQDERTLEWTARELAVLAGDPTLRALAARLAGVSARDGQEIRKLYLRYS